MDSLASWISTMVAAVVGAATGAAGVYGYWNKQMTAARTAAVSLSKKEHDLENDQYDYLFKQYRDTVERVRREHEEDRVLLIAMQADHGRCREDLAALRERIAIAERELQNRRT